MVDSSDAGRTSLGCHIYNGYLGRFDRIHDGIYDSCGSPHQFLASSTDKDTELYRIRRTEFGTAANIEANPQFGITDITGAPFIVAGTAPTIDSSVLPERIQSLIHPTITSSGPISQKNWAQLPEWVQGVLQEDVQVLFGQVNVTGSSAHATWVVAHNHGSQLTLDIHAETRASDNGNLDEEHSFDAARIHLVSILLSTNRDLQDVWAEGSLNEYGQISVQYADNISAGRIVLVSGNAVADIRGESSSTALLPLAHRLLAHTTSNERIPRTVPYILHRDFETPGERRRDAYHLGERQGDTCHMVKGIHVELLVRCKAEGRIAAANAHIADNGILFSKYETTDLDGSGGSAIAFTFVTRELGSHEVELYFADSSTMICGAEKITVEVVFDAEGGEN